MSTATIGVSSLEMPKLQPIRIEIKHVSYWVRLWKWITYIRKWRLLEDWHYTLRDKTRIVVPAGYVFNGASIPRPFWAILSPVGLLLIPSLLHDYAYQYNQLIALNDNGERVTYESGAGRAYWDTLFRDVALDVNGIAITSILAWLGVTLFGWIAWRSHRKKDL